MGAASDNAQKGRWLEITDGAVAGDIRQVTSSSVASNATTFTFPATTGATQVASGVGYILWPMWMPVTMVNRLINNAIKSLDGAFYDRVEYLGFHGDGKTYRFDIPTTLTMLTALSRRYAYDSKDIHLCDSVWTTDIDADVTASLDTVDYKEGSGSLKLVVAAGASAGDILAAQSFTAKDLSGYDYVEFWAKATSAVAAGGLKLHLHTGAIADGSTSAEVLSLPALTANKWEFCRVALANPQSDTAITYVGTELDSDAAYTCWFDGIRAGKNDSARWVPVPRHLWSVGREARDLILEPAAGAMIGSNLIKVKGGDFPAVFSNDTATSEAPERYVIAYTIYHALLMSSDPRAKQALPEGKETMEKARRSLPSLVNVRRVD